MGNFGSFSSSEYNHLFSKHIFLSLSLIHIYTATQNLKASCYSDTGMILSMDSIPDGVNSILDNQGIICSC